MSGDPHTQLLDADRIEKLLRRLGELSLQDGQTLELAVAGGAAVAMLTRSRRTTRDVDVIVLTSGAAPLVRRLAAEVGEEENLPTDWLNDGVKGYLHGLALGSLLIESAGIVVRALAPEQLVAMKLSAWRDDVDIADARELLQFIPGSRDQVWAQVEQFLVPGRELKAQYAFSDLMDCMP